MTAYELITNYPLFDGGIIVLLLTIVQIAPIKLNPWSKIMSVIGRSLNKGVEEKITKIEEKIEATDKKVAILSDRFDENTAIQARDRILRFGDEVSHGMNHSKDHFQQIINDITNYDRYCADHPKFKNNMTEITSNRIMNDYKQKDLDNSFL